MRKLLKTISLILFILIFAINLQAKSGVILKGKQVEHATGEVENMTFYLTAAVLKVHTVSPGEDMEIIYWKNKRVRIIDNKEGTYFDMTKEKAKQVGTQSSKQMSEYEKLIEEKMKDVPQEYKDMLKKYKENAGKGNMPPGAMPGMMSKKTEYKKVGTRKVGRFNTTLFSGYKGDEKAEDIYGAPPGQLNIKPEEFATVLSMMDFFEEISQQFARGFNMGGQGMFGGSDKPAELKKLVPVKEIDYRYGKAESTFEMQSGTRSNISDEVFNKLRPGLRNENPWDKMQKMKY